MCLNAYEMFCASNLHVEMGKTNVQLMRYDHFWTFAFLDPARGQRGVAWGHHGAAEEPPLDNMHIPGLLG